MNDLLAIIKGYLERNNTNYAVLINGKWGSGKTYWVRNELNQEFSSEKKVKNLKLIYISLYGINTMDDLCKKIVLQILLTLSNNNFINKLNRNSNVGVNTGVGVIKKLYETGTRFLPENINKILSTTIPFHEISKTLLLNNKNLVLCFDDLERTTLKIEVLLGCINDYVEHTNAKTIIVANEEEIKGLDEYNKIKEKIIGKSFNFEPDFGKIIDCVIDTYNSKDDTKLKYYTYLKERYEIIKEYFELSDTQNIRSLKIGLEDFGVIYEAVQNEYKELGTDILDYMLKFTIAMDAEVKIGKLNLEQLKKVKYAKLNRVFNETSGKVKEELLDSEKFIKKYYKHDSLLNYYCFDFIISLIFYGNIDKELMNNEINEIISRDKIENYQKILIYNWLELPDDEFCDALNETVSLLEEGKIGITLYYKAFIVLFLLKRDKLLTKDEYDIIHNGLLKKRENVTGKDYVFFIENYIETSTHVSDDKDYLNKLKSIKKEIIDINELALNKRSEMEVAEKIKKIKTSHDLYVFFTEYSQQLIFNQENTQSFINIMKEFQNKELYTISVILDERYEVIKSTFVNEMHFLKFLKDNIRTNTKEYNLSDSLKNRLINVLGKSIENIKLFQQNNHTPNY